MKSKLFVTVLLLAAITTIGISKNKQTSTIPEGLVDEGVAAESDKAAKAEEERIKKLPVGVRSLVGIKGIYVGIEYLNENAKSPGFTRELLKTDVELKLRLAGIKVNSYEEWKASKDGVCIYVSVNTVDVYEIDHMIYSATIKLNQDVAILRTPYIRVRGTTWDTSGTFIRSKSKFPETARQSVKDYVDISINDYLKANPKK